MVPMWRVHAAPQLNTLEILFPGRVPSGGKQQGVSLTSEGHKSCIFYLSVWSLTCLVAVATDHLFASYPDPPVLLVAWRPKTLAASP